MIVRRGRKERGKTNMPSFTCVTAITVISYLCGLGVKLSRLDDRFIPLICGVVGTALGMAGLYLMAEFPAQDLITAAAVGAASGLAATGANETVRQLMEK